MAAVLIRVDVPSLDEDTICNLIMGEGLEGKSIFEDLFIVNYSATVITDREDGQGEVKKGEEVYRHGGS